MSLGEANTEQLLALTESLTRAMEADAKAFEARRPADAAGRMAETARLANLYRHESARVRADPSLIAGAAPGQKARLRAATQSFEAVLTRHARALGAAQKVTEGVVRAIAEEIQRTRQQAAGYGPGARAATLAATSVALNQRA